MRSWPNVLKLNPMILVLKYVKNFTKSNRVCWCTQALFECIYIHTYPPREKNPVWNPDIHERWMSSKKIRTRCTKLPAYAYVVRKKIRTRCYTQSWLHVQMSYGQDQLHFVHEIPVPSPSVPSIADEVWYWPKPILRSGWLCLISRPAFVTQGDVVCWKKVPQSQDLLCKVVFPGIELDHPYPS